MTETAHKPRPAWVISLAGFAGNLTSLIFQPFENIKVRLQVSDPAHNNPVPQYRSIYHALSQIARK